MIDIHCHIYPGIDDGSGNMSDSIEMARLAASSGTRGIVVTPHCNIPGANPNYWNAELQAGLDHLQDEIEKNNIPITLFSGQEIFMGSGVIELLNDNKLITINHSRYLLVEFSMQESSQAAYHKIRQIVASGYTPIIAHPERYGFVMEYSDSIYKIKDIGGLIQVNKGSLKGFFGSRAKSTAMKIISNYQADFVASDAHSQYSRTPYLADAHEIISERFSPDYADFLLKENPYKVVNDDTIYSF